jgi:molecular chaperone GrpE
VADRTDPELRVVDRRWWARGDAAAPHEEEPRLKPTVVEELEKRLADADEQLQAVMTEYREVERGRRAVLADLLDVLDNLDRAISAAREAAQTDASETLLRGVQLVREQFLAKLEANGVTRIPSLGTPFDPQKHEAVSMVPVDDPSRAQTVVAVVREGYAVGDELLRPAAVLVGTLG